MQLSSTEITQLIDALKKAVADSAEGDKASIIQNILGSVDSPVFYAEQDNIAAAAGGAISVANYYTTINTDAGGDAFTLADGTRKGQLKKIQLIVDGGGTGVVTPASFTDSTITFADAGDFVVLIWDGTQWVALELGNAADGVTAPAVA